MAAEKRALDVHSYASHRMSANISGASTMIPFMTQNTIKPFDHLEKDKH